MAEYDGSIKISTALDNKDFLRNTDQLKHAVEGLQSVTEKAGMEMASSSNEFIDALIQGETYIDALKNSFDDLKSSGHAALAKLSAQGIGAGYQELEAELRNVRDYIAELESANVAENTDIFKDAIEQVNLLREALDFSNIGDAWNTIQSRLEQMYDLEIATPDMLQDIQDSVETLQDALNGLSRTAERDMWNSRIQTADEALTSAVDTTTELQSATSEQSNEIQSAVDNASELKSNLEDVLHTQQEISHTATGQTPAVGGVEASVSPSSDEVQETSNAFDELTRKVQRYKDAIEVKGRGSEEFEQLTNEIKRTEQEIDKLTDKKEQMERSGIDESNQGQYDKLLSTISQLKHEFGQLVAAKEEAMHAPDLSGWNNAVTLSGMLKNSFNSIGNAAQVALYAWQNPLQLIDRALGSATSKAIQFGKSFASTAIKGAINGLRNLGSRAISTASSLAKLAGNAAIKGIRNLGSVILKAASNLGKLAKMAGTGVLSFLRKLADGAKNAAVQLAKLSANAVASGIKKIGAAAVDGAKSILGIGKSARSSSGGLQIGLKSLMRYGLGVRSVFALVNKLRNAFTEAFTNMALKVPSVNKSLSSLVSSLEYLKASIATAFQPIVTTVIPYLSAFMDYLSQALAKVGEFFAVLTGQKVIYKAQKPNIDYAKSNANAAEESAAKAAQKAELAKQKEEVKAQNEAEKARVKAEKEALEAEKKRRKEMAKTTKEAENQLASFDKLDILTDTSKDDTTVDTSDIDDAINDLEASLADLPTAQDIADYVTPSVEFETVPVEKAISEFAERIRNAFEAGDFYGVGAEFAQKVNDFFDSVDWDALGTKIGNGINHLVDLYNGFMDNIHWEDIGKDLAKAANSLIESVDWFQLGRALTQHINALFKTLLGFVKEFDFSAAGKAFADMIYGMFEGIDWDAAGEALGRLITGLADFVYEAATNFPWTKVATELASGLNKMFDYIKWEKVADALIAVMNGALDALLAFIREFEWTKHGEELANGILRFVSEFPAEKAASALTEAIKSLLDFILPTISNPEFWNELGEKFAEFMTGIFTNKDMWDNIEKALSSLINGAISSIKTFVSEFPWSEVGELLKNEIEKFISDIDAKEISDALTGLISGVLDLILPLISDQSFWDGIGDKFAEFLNGVFTDKEMWSKLTDAVSNLINGFFTTVQNFVSNFKWGDAGQIFKTEFEKLVNNIDEKTIGDALKGIIKGLLDIVTPTISNSDMWSKAGAKLGKLLSNLFTDKDTWEKVRTALIGAVNSAISALTSTVTNFEWGNSGKLFHDQLLKLVDEFPLNELGSMFGELLKGVFTWFDEVFRDESIMKDLGGKLGDFLNNAFDDDDLWSSVGSALNTALANVLAFGEGLINEFKPEKAAEAIKNALKKIDFEGIASRTWELLKTAFSKTGSFVDAMFSKDVSDEVKSKADSSAYWSSVANDAGEFNAQSVGAKIGARISEAISSIPWGDFAALISKGAEGLLNNFADAMNALGKTDKDGQTAISKAIIDFFTGIEWDKVGLALLHAAWETFVTLGKSLFGLVVAGFTGEDPEGYLEENNSFGDALAGMAYNTASDPTMLDAYDNVGETAANETVNAYGNTIGAGRKDIQDATESAFELPDPSYFENEGKKPADGIVEGSINELEGQKDAISNAANTAYSVDFDNDALEKTGKEPADSIFKGYSEGVTEGAPAAEEATKKALANVAKAGKEATDSVSWKEEGKNAPDKYKEGVESGESSAANSVKKTFTTIANAAKESIKTDKFKSDGEKSVTDYQSGVEGKEASASKAVERVFTAIANSTKSGLDKAKTKEDGERLVNDLETGVTSKESSASKAVKGTITNIANEAKDAIRSIDWKEEGNKLPDDVETGITSRESSVGNSVHSTFKSIANEAKDGIREVDMLDEGANMPESLETGVDRASGSAERTIYSDFKSIADSGADAIKDKDWPGVGENIVAGVEKGAQQNKSSLLDQLKDIARSALDAAKRALGIHSPSRVFRDEVGVMLGAGIAEGIEQSEPTVLASISDIARAMTDEAKNIDTDTDVTFSPDMEANGDMMVNGLDGVLNNFSDRVQDSFITLLDRLESITNTVTFRTPKIAAGTVLPYNIAATSAMDSKSTQNALDVASEDIISAMIQSVNNQTTAIIRAMEQYAGRGNNIDPKALADFTIKEINTRTRSTGKSPILI